MKKHGSKTCTGADFLFSLVFLTLEGPWKFHGKWNSSNKEGFLGGRGGSDESTPEAGCDLVAITVNILKTTDLYALSDGCTVWYVNTSQYGCSKTTLTFHYTDCDTIPPKTKRSGTAFSNCKSSSVIGTQGIQGNSM